MSYQIGIKRRAWFGFKTYYVTGHQTEVIGSTARLVLMLPNGAKLAIPNIHRRTLYVYPEYVPPVQSEV